MESPNILKTAERKKILSNIESLGLLSAAEKAGLSLSKVPGFALLWIISKPETMTEPNGALLGASFWRLNCDGKLLSTFAP